MAFEINNVPTKKGRVAIVTGANTGLGFETALVFAGLGMKTILACRTESRAREAMKRIKAEVPGADLKFLQIDLSDLSNVRAFAERFRSSYDKLDHLVLNAGIMMPPYATTTDGFESQMGANYFGHFLLTSLLIDLMPDDPSSRVVALSSGAHRMGNKRIQFDDLHWEKDYSAIAAYAQTKLACLMFGNELDRQLKAHGQKIVSLSAHPGLSTTELGRFSNPVLVALLKYTLAPLVAQSPANGARPQIRAALDDNAKGGEYYGPTGFKEFKGPPGKVPQLAYAQDEKNMKELWDVSKELTGAVFPWEASPGSVA